MELLICNWDEGIPINVFLYSSGLVWVVSSSLFILAVHNVVHFPRDCGLGGTIILHFLFQNHPT